MVGLVLDCIPPILLASYSYLNKFDDCDVVVMMASWGSWWGERLYSNVPFPFDHFFFCFFPPVAAGAFGHMSVMR